LLGALDSQKKDGSFTYSVVITDNDSDKSAERVAIDFCSATAMRIDYCTEPRQNIALARNKALQCADGELVAFIDDDELPVDHWLLSLFKTYEEFGADGILGPVLPYFDHDPPRWVRNGRFFDRPNHVTGHMMSWSESRTGNLLFRKSIINGNDSPFRPEFDTAGEDMDFFRRMIDRGFVFRWCSNAVAYELVPPERCNLSFLMKRALLRGSNFPKHPKSRAKNLLCSIVAVPTYMLALPFLALCDRHMFLKYLVKLCDHSSRLLAFAGWRVMTKRET
jgi:succinoglycan biosynthesis protein ExoM